MNTDKNDPKQDITSAEYLEATDWVAHGIERLTDNPFAIRLAKALRYGIHRECVGGEDATRRAVEAERAACLGDIEHEISANGSGSREGIALHAAAARILRRARGEAPR